MNYKVLIFLNLLSFVTKGQKINSYKERDYPVDQFIVKIEERTVGSITIQLIHTKPKKQDASTQFSCRTWLTVKKGKQMIHELAQDINPVGGCAGLFFPDSQPIKDLVIISKFGDYHGKLYVVDTHGKIKEYAGGFFYVSNNNTYLFTNHDSDLPGVSIIDLTKNELIYSGELKDSFADWYEQDGQYFAVVMSNDAKIAGEPKILIFDFATKTFVEKQAKEKIDPKHKMKFFKNHAPIVDCSCG